MKNRTLLILLTAFCVLAAAAAVSAESGLYPIGQYTQPSYPNPQYSQPGQQNPYYNPNYNSPYYNYPYYIAPTPTPQPTPDPYFYQQQPNNPNPYYQPQQNYQQPYYQPQQNNRQPYYYDPNTGYYFYQFNQQPQAPYYQPQQPPQKPGPWGPGGWYQDPNVQVTTKRNHNGTTRLTWEIRNTTAENWDKGNIDIKCISGCHNLANPNRILWDIPYTVRRGEKLSYSIDIRDPFPGETMTFAMVAGSKTLYTFNVHL